MLPSIHTSFPSHHLLSLLVNDKNDYQLAVRHASKGKEIMTLFKRSSGRISTKELFLIIIGLLIVTVLILSVHLIVSDQKKREQEQNNKIQSYIVNPPPPFIGERGIFFIYHMLSRLLVYCVIS